jgi:hypothetical protein
MHVPHCVSRDERRSCAEIEPYVLLLSDHVSQSRTRVDGRVPVGFTPLYPVDTFMNW